MSMNRRDFLRTTAAGTAGAAALGAGAYALAAGTDYTYQGIDISHWQGAINWAQVKASGKTFAFCKATEGTSFVDSRFASNWAAMKNNGLIRGAYHFGRPGTDPVAQANHFCNVVAPRSGDLQMTLDIEVTDGRTPSQIRSWIVAFINRIVQRTGRPGIIYTGYYFWRDRAGNGSNLNCPLWLAYWGSGNPQNFVPSAWSSFSFWQYTSTGSCPGVSGNVDRDAWNGSLAGLNRLRLP
jgi:lysozyme